MILAKPEAPGTQICRGRRYAVQLPRRIRFLESAGFVWIENCISSCIMYIVRPSKAARLRHHGRSSHPYPIRTAVAYRVIGRDRFSKSGTGWTILLSSRSVLIESETSLPLERRVDLWIEWPARLENKIGLRLHIYGRTVSVAGTATEIEILAYEFHTCALAPGRATACAFVTTA